MSTFDTLVHPYTERHSRHWSPRSEKYTGVDSLLGLMQTGWMLSKRVLRHETWRNRRCPIIVYYFELNRGKEMVTVAVVNNPLITPFIKDNKLEVISQTFWDKTH